jgi:DnaJ-class molecular chaperone
MFYGRPLPRRCRLCNGSGEGQTVITSKGMYIERCRRCKGTGQLHYTPQAEYRGKQRPYGQA